MTTDQRPIRSATVRLGEATGPTGPTGPTDPSGPSQALEHRRTTRADQLTRRRLGQLAADPAERVLGGVTDHGDRIDGDGGREQPVGQMGHRAVDACHGQSFPALIESCVTCSVDRYASSTVSPPHSGGTAVPRTQS